MCTCCREGGEKHVLLDCFEVGHSIYKIIIFNTLHEHIAVPRIPYKTISQCSLRLKRTHFLVQLGTELLCKISKVFVWLQRVKKTTNYIYTNNSVLRNEYF